MPDKPKIEPCKGCGAMMIWALSDNGRPMPFDAKPQRLFDLGQDELGRWHASTRIVYTPHHATCPKADRFRKPKQTSLPMEDHHERRDLD